MTDSGYIINLLTDFALQDIYHIIIFKINKENNKNFIDLLFLEETHQSLILILMKNYYYYIIA